MQTYIYVENGTTQIVLTPETDFEKHIVEDFDFAKSTIKTFKGNFSEYQGGWVRLFNYKDSLIIKCDYKPDKL